MLRVLIPSHKQKYMESCYDLENKVLTLGEVRNFVKMLEEKM